MTKIYPRWSTAAISPVPYSKSDKSFDDADAKNLTTLTVWKKSLLFNCDGFTVFVAQGNLVYRIDNYLSGSDIVLMDASGNSLLTIRRKKWKLGVDNTWMVFKGDEIKNSIFCMRKNTNFLGKNTCLAYLSSTDHENVHKSRVYEIEGSYCRRCCGVYDDKGRKVAEIKQKEAPVKGVAFGMDIFSLVVQPGLIDTSLAMAIVIMLDQMFGSSKTSPRNLLTNFKS